MTRFRDFLTALWLVPVLCVLGVLGGLMSKEDWD
jgi:hypothetical protein